MNREEILSAIRILAMSQGCYGRLYNVLSNGSEESEDYLLELENQNFKDIVDLILYIES